MHTSGGNTFLLVHVTDLSLVHCPLLAVCWWYRNRAPPEMQWSRASNRLHMGQTSCITVFHWKNHTTAIISAEIQITVAICISFHFHRLFCRSTVALMKAVYLG